MGDVRGEISSQDRHRVGFFVFVCLFVCLFHSLLFFSFWWSQPLNPLTTVPGCRTFLCFRFCLFVLYMAVGGGGGGGGRWVNIKRLNSLTEFRLSLLLLGPEIRTSTGPPG